jgi:hypothetical protein
MEKAGGVFFAYSTVVVLTVAVLLLAWVYQLAFGRFDHFKKRGIPTVQPIRPFVGNIWRWWQRASMQTIHTQQEEVFFFFFEERKVSLQLS